VTPNEQIRLLGSDGSNVEGGTALAIESSTDLNAPVPIWDGLESDLPARWIMAMRLALISFIATSWFLSRAYQSTMYLILGLATATILLDKQSDEPGTRARWVCYTLAIEAVLIVFIYLVVRLRF
jgi:hypothetical protein